MASRTGTGLGKVAGFFKRSIYRVGRGAYIEADKRNIKKELYTALRNGTISQAEIIAFSSSSDNAIQEKSFLNYEKKTQESNTKIQEIIVNEIAGSSDPLVRKEAFEKLYDELTREVDSKIDMTQLEKSVARIEKKLAKIDLETMELTINTFDIGRIGNERT